MSGRGAERTLSLIEWMATKTEPVSLTDAVQSLGMPKSSCLGLLRMLVDLGYAIRTDPTHYALIRLPGEPDGENRALGTLARLLSPVVQAAVKESRESGFVAVLQPDLSVHYLNKYLPDREIRYDRNIKVPRQANRVSSGLVLLGDLEDEALRTYAQSCTSGPDETRYGDSLVSEVRTTSTQGFAANKQGVVEGAAGVSAPILSSTGRIIAALNLAGPALRVTRNLDEITHITCKYAEQASEVLRAADFRKDPTEKVWPITQVTT